MKEKKLWRLAAEELISDNEKEVLLESIHDRIKTESCKKQRTSYMQRFILSAAAFLVIAVIVSVSLVVGLSSSDTTGDIFYSDKNTTQIELNGLEELKSYYEGNINIDNFNMDTIYLNIDINDSTPVYFDINYVGQNIIGTEDEIKLTIFLVENFDYNYEENFVLQSSMDFEIELNDSLEKINYYESEMLNTPMMYTAFSKFKVNKYTYYVEGKYLKIPEITQIDNLVKYVLEQIF